MGIVADFNRQSVQGRSFTATTRSSRLGVCATLEQELVLRRRRRSGSQVADGFYSRRGLPSRRTELAQSTPVHGLGPPIPRTRAVLFAVKLDDYSY